MTAAAALDPVALLRDALDEPVELRETHASWVLLGERTAYKVKKPVSLPFLDFGTLEQRRAACRAEIALNRMLAPSVYRAVRALVPSEGGARLAAEDAPGAVEYVVEMRRYADADTLAARLARGDADPAVVDRLGVELAGFHERTPIVPERHGAEPLRRWVDDTLASLTTLAAGGRQQRLVARAGRFAAAFVAARRSQLDDRARRGHLRDGHGDLRLEHVLLEGDRLSIVDCIEFDDRLRRIDVASDLAFLVMDLHASRRPDLADRLVAAYRFAGGDAGDDALLAWLAAYRAQVRAKVAYLRAAQLQGDAAAASRAEGERLLVLGDRLLWRARGLVTVVVAGPAASGKSTLAGALADRAGWPAFSFDRIRKADAGLLPQERATAERYGAEVNRHVYTELGALSARSADGAVVDATFRATADRAAFLSAHDGARPLLVVECATPAAVRVTRARTREDDATRISDADAVVTAAQAMEPLDEIAPADHLTVRGDAPCEAQLDAVADALDRRLLDRIP